MGVCSFLFLCQCLPQAPGASGVGAVLDMRKSESLRPDVQQSPLSATALTLTASHASPFSSQGEPCTDAMEGSPPHLGAGLVFQVSLLASEQLSPSRPSSTAFSEQHLG